MSRCNKIESIKFSSFELKYLLSKLSIATGINFDYYRDKFVEKRIKSRMIRLKITNATSYLNYILKNPDEIDKFKSIFTINISYFFRNRELFEMLARIIYESLKASNKIFQREKINNKIALLDSNLIENGRNDRIKLPEIVRQLSLFKKLQTNLNLNIWSCACASGEEPYSLAIMLNEFKENILNFPSYRIIASDIDNNSLENAYKGIYSEEVMNEVPKIYRLKYFKTFKGQFGQKYSVCDKIKKQVTFFHEDVTKPHKKSYIYDIILCRYFLIYTEKDARDQILETLEEHLAKGGLLVLGKTETLFDSSKNLKLIDNRNHIYLKTTDN